MRLGLLFLGLGWNAFAAGPIVFGVRGGAPINDSNSMTNTLINSTGAASVGQRYEVGPTLGVRLPLGFSVEGDALFNRQTLNFGQFAGFTAASTHSDSWEFPVMLKFTAGRQAIAPVFGAGVSVRHINNFSLVPSFLFNQTTSPNSVGFVASGGIRCKLGPVNVTPELRYTHWNGDSFSNSIANFLPLNSNEASVLVGLTF